MLFTIIGEKMSKKLFGKGTKILVLCEIWDGGFCDEFYITLAGISFYLNKNLVSVNDTPHSNKWVPGEIPAEVIEDYGDNVLVRLPLQEKIIGDNPIEISKYLIRAVNQSDLTL